MNQTINKSTQEQAADAVAAALAEGMDPEAVGEAISLTANQLVLRSTSDRTHGNSIFISPALARMIHERHWNCANVFSESISGLTQQPFDDVRRFDARQAVVESLESVREPVVVET